MKTISVICYYIGEWPLLRGLIKAGLLEELDKKWGKRPQEDEDGYVEETLGI